MGGTFCLFVTNKIAEGISGTSGTILAIAATASVLSPKKKLTKQQRTTLYREVRKNNDIRGTQAIDASEAMRIVRELENASPKKAAKLAAGIEAAKNANPRAKLGGIASLNGGVIEYVLGKVSLTKKQVLDLAKKHGIELPDDVEVIFVNKEELPTVRGKKARATWGKGTQFLNPNSIKEIGFDSLKVDGKIVISIDEDLLRNPSGAVGSLAHELHEVQGTRKTMKERDGEFITEHEMVELLDSDHRIGHGGLLHQEALLKEIDIAKAVGGEFTIKGFGIDEFYGTNR